MIIGNNEKFNSPIRSIGAKVELSDGGSISVSTTGNPIVIDDAVPFSELELSCSCVICGKNLINPAEWLNTSQKTTVNGDVFTTEFTSGGIHLNAQWLKAIKYPAGTYTLTFYPESEGAACAFFIYAVSDGSIIKQQVLANADTPTLTFTAKEPFYPSIAGNNSYKGTHSFRLQLEVGSVSTAYEPYQSQSNIATLSDITTIYSLAEANIEATYEKQLNSFSHIIPNTGDLVSLVIDRAGENKFFGFGVAQKVEIQLRDKDRNYEIPKGTQAKVLFDDIATMPFFYVDEVKRNENTNALTLTAFDKIQEAQNRKFEEITLTSFTLGELALAIAKLLGLGLVLAPESNWNEAYPEGANLDGSETLREVLNDIAEATQTIYFINYENKLVFKRLGGEAYSIDKSQYFTLSANPALTLTTLVSSTELGDNYEKSVGPGETQYIRDNCFWTYREDVADLVEQGLAAIQGLTITPFECKWRGNYLLEVGDKIELTTKDNEVITSYLLNDKLTYTGGMKQQSQWVYEAGNNETANPTSLGEVLKQTFAKVDKANQQIDIVASNTNTNNESISQLQLKVGEITTSVEQTVEALGGINNDVAALTEKVSTQITPEAMEVEVKRQITESGVAKVETTTGFRFDESGLTVSKSNQETSTLITEDGMVVNRSGEPVLRANNQGVMAEDLHATTFLIIGSNSRLEDKGNRTACFWIGG